MWTVSRELRLGRAAAQVHPGPACLWPPRTIPIEDGVAVWMHGEWQVGAVGPTAPDALWLTSPSLVMNPTLDVAQPVNTRAWAARRTFRGVYDFAEIM